MNKTPKTLAQVEEQRPAVLQDEATALIAQAIEKNVPVETMEKLLAMRRELKAEKAKEAYDSAMAAFQAECPTIEKTKQGYGYKYAPLESIVEQVKDLLSKHGFSYKFNTDEREGGTIIYCRINHIGGHFEDSQVSIDKETTTKMNASQQSGAVMTYGKRYAFCNALGILTGDEDTDARTTSPSPSRPTMQQAHQETILPITSDQKGDLMILLGKLGKTQPDLNKVVKIKFKKESYQLLTKNEADALILYMRNSLENKTVGKLDSPDMTEDEINEIAQGIEQQKLNE